MKTSKPQIWKRESCTEGECEPSSTEHCYGIPACSPGGLSCQCFKCDKVKFVEIE